MSLNRAERRGGWNTNAGELLNKQENDNQVSIQLQFCKLKYRSVMHLHNSLSGDFEFHLTCSQISLALQEVLHANVKHCSVIRLYIYSCSLSCSVED